MQQSQRGASGPQKVSAVYLGRRCRKFNVDEAFLGPASAIRTVCVAAETKLDRLRPLLKADLRANRVSDSDAIERPVRNCLA